MMITANQLVAHAVGDYLLQSHWMASNKTTKSVACLVHVTLYTLPFMLLTQSWVALCFIAGSHFVIDRWRLARYVCWFKNLISPPSQWKSWESCKGTGYSTELPSWMSVWLLIIADNVMHVLLNAAAIRWL